MRKSYQGFTLIELLVVVAIIGILAAVGVVAYNGYTKAAKKRVTEQNHNRMRDFANVSFVRCESGAPYIEMKYSYKNYLDNEDYPSYPIIKVWSGR